MPDTATRTGPELEHLTQKERILHHLRRNDELERTEAGRRYHIGRLSARILDLKEEGYVFDTEKDDDGKAHYSLVSEPGEQAGTEKDSSGGSVNLTSADDLLAYLDGKDALAYRYVKLLKKAATGGYPVGMMQDTVQAEALSDWEAAACIDRDVTVSAITETREKLCRASDLVRRAGHRKGKATYALHPELID